MILFRLWILLFTCLMVGVSSLQFECPEPEDIYPCYCEEEEEDDNQPSMFCNHFTTPEEIQKAMRGLKGHKMYKMHFFMNWILEPMNSEVFKKIAVERLQFERSTLTLTPPQFQGMEDHLKSLQLRSLFNKTNPIGTWSLGHLKHLKELSLDKNKIMTLPNNWLTSVPDSLTSLFVEDNNILTLEDKVFAKATSVVFIVLDSNKLTALSRSMFPNPAPKLRSLTLNYNKLRYLPHDLFDDMPNLRIVEITNNRLTYLDDTVWKRVFEQLTKLDFSDNDLQCDSSLKWMFKALNKPTLLYGECAKPEHLQGKSIKRLREEDIK